MKEVRVSKKRIYVDKTSDTIVLPYLKKKKKRYMLTLAPRKLTLGKTLRNAKLFSFLLRHPTKPLNGV